MSTCDRIRPLLYRLAEQEAEPAEAIEAARHLPRCTACKILLARERRLALLLERELVDLTVDDTFVRDVMDTLPAQPPRRAAQIRVLRGLKLACLAGLLLLGGTSIAPHGVAAPETTWFAAPRMEFDGPGDTGSPALAAAALTVRALATAVPALLAQPLTGVGALAVVVGVGLILLLVLSASGLLGLAFAGWCTRLSPGPASRAGWHG